jgi:hypothetical protein
VHRDLTVEIPRHVRSDVGLPANHEGDALIQVSRSAVIRREDNRPDRFRAALCPLPFVRYVWMGVSPRVCCWPRRDVGGAPQFIWGSNRIVGAPRRSCASFPGVKQESPSGVAHQAHADSQKMGDTAKGDEPTCSA